MNRMVRRIRSAWRRHSLPSLVCLVCKNIAYQLSRTRYEAQDGSFDVAYGFPPVWAALPSCDGMNDASITEWSMVRGSVHKLGPAYHRHSAGYRGIIFLKS